MTNGKLNPIPSQIIFFTYLLRELRKYYENKKCKINQKINQKKAKSHHYEDRKLIKISRLRKND